MAVMAALAVIGAFAAWPKAEAAPVSARSQSPAMQAAPIPTGNQSPAMPTAPAPAPAPVTATATVTNDPPVSVPPAQSTAFRATHRIKTNDGSKLRLRSEPSTKGTQIDSLDNGSYVQVLETGEKFVDSDGYTGNWMRVRTQNNKTGWCFGAYLTRL
jgi:hypothetical protein